MCRECDNSQMSVERFTSQTGSELTEEIARLLADAIAGNRLREAVEHDPQLRAWLDAQPDPCERCAERPSRYAVKERYVEDHLCEECMQSDMANIDEGLGELYRYSGLEDASQYIPITETETCGNIREGEAGLCGRPASYARITFVTDLVCDVNCEGPSEEKLKELEANPFRGRIDRAR
jgi:hypothetical protein